MHKMNVIRQINTFSTTRSVYTHDYRCHSNINTSSCRIGIMGAGRAAVRSYRSCSSYYFAWLWKGYLLAFCSSSSSSFNEDADSMTSNIAPRYVSTLQRHQNLNTNGSGLHHKVWNDVCADPLQTITYVG